MSLQGFKNLGITKLRKVRDICAGAGKVSDSGHCLNLLREGMRCLITCYENIQPILLLTNPQISEHLCI